MDDASRIEVAKQYLRRKYSSNVPGLRALANTVAESAFEAVTITGQGFEGGNAQAVVTFEPLAYLGAIESLILELDPDNTPSPPDATRFADFGSNFLES